VPVTPFAAADLVTGQHQKEKCRDCALPGEFLCIATAGGIVGVRDDGAQVWTCEISGPDFRFPVIISYTPNLALQVRGREEPEMRIAVSVGEKEKARGAESPYFRALLAAGADASELELVSAADAPTVRARDFDGILFAGGEDVDPSFYGEAKQHENVHDHRPRDEFEFFSTRSGTGAPGSHSGDMPRRADDQCEVRRFAIPGYEGGCGAAV